MNPQGPAAVYRAYLRAERERDEVAMSELLAPDIEIELNGAPALGSAEEDAAAMAALFAAYPDYHRELVELIEEGDTAAARWRMVGHPRPDLADRLPEIDIRGCSIVAVAGGRMTQAFVWSPADALERILELVGPIAASD